MKTKACIIKWRHVLTFNENNVKKNKNLKYNVNIQNADINVIIKSYLQSFHIICKTFTFGK